MAIEFNHTIVWARDSQTSATFLADVLGSTSSEAVRPFLVVATDNGANIDFMDAEGEITAQHYAFLVSESEFDEVLGRICQRKGHRCLSTQRVENPIKFESEIM